MGASKKKSTTKQSPTKVSKPSKSIKTSSDMAPKKSAGDVILELVAEAYSLGKDSLERERLTVGTELAAKTVTNNLAKLKQKGLVEYDSKSKSISLTEKGIATVGSLANRPTTNAARQEMILKTLKGKQIDIIKLLHQGETHSKDTVAKTLGYEGSKVKAFVNLIGSMRSKGFVEYPDTTTVRLTAACFIKDRGEE